MGKYYKYKFDRIVFNNRWKLRKFQRSGNWVIVGISERWISPRQFEYTISFFGFDIRFWFIRLSKNEF